jgi:hypothetical protein
VILDLEVDRVVVLREAVAPGGAVAARLTRVRLLAGAARSGRDLYGQHLGPML